MSIPCWKWVFYFHLVFGCKERFAIWLSPNSCLMVFCSVASFEKCMGELVNWIVKYHFSTSSASMKDTTKQWKVRFWPGILLGTKTWNPLLSLTEYTHKWVAQFWPGTVQEHGTPFSDGLYTQGVAQFWPGILLKHGTHFSDNNLPLGVGLHIVLWMKCIVSE
jgi:hypothetical protein